MVQIKTFNNTLQYNHQLIDNVVNDWLRANTGGVHIMDIKYNVTNDGYESVLIIYESLREPH